jgi:hypothetical protein
MIRFLYATATNSNQPISGSVPMPMKNDIVWIPIQNGSVVIHALTGRG